MILATNNSGKIKEIKKILDYDIKSLKDVNIEIEVVEDQDTFLGNALKKAQEIYKITGEAVIADDSGLCIKCLNNFPGVLTHRFLGENATDEERNKALIEKIGFSQDRTAYVICNLVYYDGVNTIIGEGILEGIISFEPRGNNGFGFDPIFELTCGKTLAELSPEEKNQISARYLAAKDLKAKLEEIYIDTKAQNLSRK